MSSNKIQVDTVYFQNLINRYRSILSQIESTTAKLDKEFKKIESNGDIWKSEAEAVAIEKEYILNNAMKDVNSVLRYKLNFMTTALNSYQMIDQLINNKIDGGNK